MQPFSERLQETKKFRAGMEGLMVDLIQLPSSLKGKWLREAERLNHLGE